VHLVARIHQLSREDIASLRNKDPPVATTASVSVDRVCIHNHVYNPLPRRLQRREFASEAQRSGGGRLWVRVWKRNRRLCRHLVRSPSPASASFQGRAAFHARPSAPLSNQHLRPTLTQQNSAPQRLCC